MNRQTKKCLINGRKSRDTVPLRGPCAIDWPSLVLNHWYSVKYRWQSMVMGTLIVREYCTQMFCLAPSIPSLFPPCLIFTSREIGLKFFFIKLFRMQLRRRRKQPRRSYQLQLQSPSRSSRKTCRKFCFLCHTSSALPLSMETFFI